MMFEKTEPHIDPGAFWRTLGARPIGATVITTAGENGPEGFLGLSFAHVSAKPPVVLVSVGKSTSAMEAIRQSGAFAANILNAEAEEIARGFGGERAREERFVGVPYSRFVTGSPVFDDAQAVFDCRILKEIDSDDTVIFLAQVVGLRAGNDAGRALVAYQGGYRSL